MKTLTLSLQEIFNIRLTHSQREAVNKLNAFLESNLNCFILTGYAGTGKTFLLKKLSEYFNRLGQPFYFLSPTGRAARIIQDRTNQSASTIHSKIYMFYKHSKIEVLEDSSEYKLHFKLRENEDSENTIYIIDESSMLSDQFQQSETLRFGSGKLLSDLVAFINPRETNRKIIFIGDPAQLPPVQSNFSPALSKDYLTKHFALTCDGYELTDVYRQSKDSQILSQATKLRNRVKESNYLEFPITPNDDDLKELSTSEAINRYITNWKYSILIASTNANVYQYNKSIRESLGLTQLTKNERLLITKNTMVQGIPLYNGDFVYTKWVSPKLEEHTVRLKENGEVKTVTLSFRDVVILAESNGKRVKLKTKIIENHLFRSDRGLSALELRALIADFTKRHKHLKQNSELFKQELSNDPYMNALHVKFGYAMTCHKSQGGEWNEVFIDFDFYHSIQSEYFFRWSYTAITRSKKQLYVVNLLDSSVSRENQQNKEQFAGINVAVKNELKKNGFTMNDIFYYDHQIQYTIKNIRVSLWYNADDLITAYSILDDADEDTTRTLSNIFNTFKGKSITSYVYKEENKKEEELLKTDFLLNNIRNPFQEIDVKIKNISFHNYLVKYNFVSDHKECTINFYYNSKDKVTNIRHENGDEELSKRILEHLKF